MSVISAIRDFIAAECPYLDEFSEVFSGVSKVEVDTLDENPKNYMIEVAPADPVVRTYTNGDTVRRVAFHFSSSGPASMALNEGIKNNFNALPFPLIQDESAGLTNPAIGCGFAGWGISSLCDETTRDIAWQFLKYMISYDGQQALINAGLATPSIRIDLAEGKTWSSGYNNINLDAWLQWSQYKVSSQFFTTQEPSATFDIYSALQNFMRNLVDPGLTGVSTPRSVEMCIALCEEDLREAIS